MSTAPREQASTSVFETVIVGVDFSRASRLIVRQAMRLARDFRAELIVVHAAAEPIQVTGPEGLPVPVTRGLHLIELSSSLRRFYRLPENVREIVRRGSPARLLSRIASTVPRPLIVVGTSSRSTVSRFFLGSQAEELAVHSLYPVWVHRGDRVVSLRHLLVPTDLSETSQSLADVIDEWSEDQGLSVSYLFVRPELPMGLSISWSKEHDEKLLGGLLQAMARFRERPRKLLTDAGDPVERICRRARRYDVVVMSPHNRSGLFQSFGQVTTQVIRHSEVPVLVVKSLKDLIPANVDT